MKKIFLFIFIFIFSSKFFSQNQIFNRTPCEQVHIPVCIHNIAYAHNKFTNYSRAIYDIKTAFKYLEKDCIFLDICLIDSIYDYNYYNLSDEDKVKEYIEMTNMYHKPYYLNVYINNTLDISKYNGITGSAQDTNYMIFSPTSLNYPYRMRLVLVNYFGLNPLANSSDNELVNGSNSAYTGDSLWDTPADPFYKNPNFYVLPKYFPSNQYLYLTNVLDKNNDMYNVMYDNIMSPFNDNFSGFCDLLTRNQWQRIGYNESKYRFNRWKVEK